MSEEKYLWLWIVFTLLLFLYLLFFLDGPVPVNVYKAQHIAYSVGPSVNPKTP